MKDEDLMSALSAPERLPLDTAFILMCNLFMNSKHLIAVKYVVEDSNESQS